MLTQNHPFHLVNISPWPIFSAFASLFLTMGLIEWFHFHSFLLSMIGLTLMILTTIQWWRDIIRESTFQGCHSFKVSKNMKWGMILFITSEIFFFLSFFWAFFHSSLSPETTLGLSWPPSSVTPFNQFKIPLLNTIILLSSGVSITWSHHALSKNNFSQSLHSLILTIILGMYFSYLQALEYMEAPFSIADSIYGSTFFIATGFHGLHVIIGTTFILVTTIRLLILHFSKIHHLGFEAAAWYWHFVDVVWLFLYISIYWWGK